jgi:transposase InsO family protein
MFDRFGLVEEVVTDNGVQFILKEFEDFLAAHSVKHSKSALYSPQANAAVERLNGVSKEGIKAALAEGKPFMTGLRQVLATYRMNKHATTGVSPASL